MKKLILSAALALTVLASGITSVKAGVSQNFDFNFTGVGHWQLTGVADKNNTSYVAMKCLYAEVPGSSYKAVVVEYPSQTQSSSIYKFAQGTYHLMANNVYEHGARQARIDAWCDNDNGGQEAEFSGYWYADSDIY